MEIVQEPGDIARLRNNRVIGTNPAMEGSVIEFAGENNILFCEENVNLKNARLRFRGGNSLIYLSTSRYSYIMNMTLYNDSAFYMGTQNYINGGKTMVVDISEHKHCFIGDYCMFSLGTFIRNADVHLIYDCKTLSRVNSTKSIFIGDHVWIGQNCTLLKGTRIDSGSIIGANTTIAGTAISHNSIWAGAPCRKIKDDIFWDAANVHSWLNDMTEASQNYENFLNQWKPECTPGHWIYKYDGAVSISYDEIDKMLSAKQSSEERLEVIMEINRNKEKNRFVHKII